MTEHIRSYTDTGRLLDTYRTKGLVFADTWEEIEAAGAGHVYDVVLALCHLVATISEMHADITGGDPAAIAADILNGQAQRLIRMDTAVRFKAITGGLK